MRFKASTLALALGLSLLSATDVAEAQEGGAPKRPELMESSAYPPSNVRLKTALGGLGLTTGAWGLSAFTAFAASGASAIDRLYLPVVGPWQTLTQRSCGGSCEIEDYFASSWYILLGLAQAGGLGIALESLLIPTSNQAAAPGGDSNDSTPSHSPSGPPSGDPGAAPAGPGDKTPVDPDTPMYLIPTPSFFGKAGWGLSWGGIF